MRISYGIQVYLFLIIAVRCPLLLMGQSPADVRDRINSIKLDENYLYAEATHQDLNLAYENALAELLLAVNECRASCQKSPLEISDLTGRVEQLDYQRGEKSMVFVYMQTAKAKAVQRRESRNIAIERSETKPASPTTRKDEVEVDAPAVSTSPPERDSPRPEPPIAVPEPLSAELKALAEDEVAQLVLQIEMVTDIGGFMEDYKLQGEVSSYGRARSMEDIPDDAYLILYDHTRAIRTVLSPAIQGKRLNLRNKQEDTVTNYRGHGVYWYKK